MTDDALMVLLTETADVVGEALRTVACRGLVEGSATQHYSDVATDEAARRVLHGAGVSVLSEESGMTYGGAGEAADGQRGADQPLTVVVDPLDGSTNAAAGLPWYATSLCAVDSTGARAALVRNLATGEEWQAVRGHGATRDGRPLRSPVGRTDRLPEALVMLSGHPAQHLGWRQYRTFGALALDLCVVAGGQVDGYLDCSVDAHGVWDYLGGMLVAQEAGVDVADVHGRPLLVLDPVARRTPVAGPPGLLELLRERWPDAAGAPLRGPAAVASGRS